MLQVFNDLFTKYVDIELAVLIVISSYFFKKYISDNILPKIQTVHKILIWATIVSVVYYFSFQKTGVVERQPAVIYFITYFFATSFYELIWQPVERWIKKATEDKKDDTVID